MILEREAMRSPRRLVTLVAAPLAVCFSKLSFPRITYLFMFIGVIGIAA
jgi:hypothetical protein